MKRARSTPAPATCSAAGWRIIASPASRTRPTSTCISTKADFDHVLGGSVGIGEVATVPTSPAIANAICNATGIRLTELPIRPDRLDRRTQREGRRMTPAAMTATQAGRNSAPPAPISPSGAAAASRRGPLIDIVRRARHDGHASGALTERLRIGAFTTIAAIAADARIAAAYPGIAASAQGLATPQIRHLATLGGNLAQRSRCWYFRNPHIACLKKGGSDCPARSGNHLYGVAFDLGPCVAPHPSTMAAALLAYDATSRDRPSAGSLTIARRPRRRLQRQRRQRAAAGRMIKGIELAGTAAGRARALQARDQPHPCGVAAGRESAPAPWSRTARSSSSASPPAASPRCRCGSRRSEAALQGKPANAANYCRCRRTGDIGRKAVADDGIQARSAERRGAGSAGAAGGIRCFAHLTFRLFLISQN